MARGRKKNVELGYKQMTVEDFMTVNSDSSQYVAQANKLILSRQNLKENSLKVLRLAIMQIKPTDHVVHPYRITIPELSSILNVDAKTLYKTVRNIVDDINKNPIFIEGENNKGKKWVSVPWTQMCQYDSDFGLVIKLNDELTPLLIGLSEYYSQYQLANILDLQTAQGIRLFEILRAKIGQKVISSEGATVSISIQELKDYFNADVKYERFSNFHQKIVKRGVYDINEHTCFSLEYSFEHENRTVTRIVFVMKSKFKQSIAF